MLLQPSSSSVVHSLKSRLSVVVKGTHGDVMDKRFYWSFALCCCVLQRDTAAGICRPPLSPISCHHLESRLKSKHEGQPDVGCVVIFLALYKPRSEGVACTVQRVCMSVCMGTFFDPCQARWHTHGCITHTMCLSFHLGTHVFYHHISPSSQSGAKGMCMFQSSVL